MQSNVILIFFLIRIYSSPLFFLEKKYWTSFLNKSKIRKRTKSLDHKDYNHNDAYNHDSVKAEIERVS